MNNFTPEDLLLYLYNEMEPVRNSLLEKELESNWPLREKLNVLKASAQRLDKLVVTPRSHVIHNIMQYARNTAGVYTH